jgi:hypothetical protein
MFVMRKHFPESRSSMAKSAWREGYKNWGRGPSSGRPASVGTHDILQDQLDPSAKGLDPNEAYKGGGSGNGPNTGLGIADGAGGPVNIKVKGNPEVEIVPDTGKPRIGG